MNNDADDRRHEWKYGVKPGPCRSAIAAGICFLAAAVIMGVAYFQSL